VSTKSSFDARWRIKTPVRSWWGGVPLQRHLIFMYQSAHKFRTSCSVKETGCTENKPVTDVERRARMSFDDIAVRDWRRRPPLRLRVMKRLDICWCWIKCTRCDHMRAVAVAPGGRTCSGKQLVARRAASEAPRCSIRAGGPTLAGRRCWSTRWRLCRRSSSNGQEPRDV
jgi:hypothetical protein